MTRRMSRDDFLEIVYDELRDDPTNDRANRIIDAFDSVDAEPIRHGEWTDAWNSLDYEHDYVCSICNEHAYYFIDSIDGTWSCIDSPNYCPNCGAKMDGKAL